MHHISVIIPTYNRIALLPACLNSVLAQTHMPSEIIVVDDGSTDTTKTWIQQQHPNITYLHQNNLGVSAARNLGIKQAKHDWIALLDSDDTWHKDKLYQQSQALMAQSDYLFCHTDEIWMRNGVRVNAMHKHKKYGGDIFNHCLPLCCISPSSVLMHKDLFEQVGFFDESLPACEDYDLWLQICCQYPVLYLEQKLLTKYGGHTDQLSKKYQCMDRFRLQALDKLIRQQHLSTEQHQAASNMLLHKANILLKGALKHQNIDNTKYCELLISQYAKT